MPRKKKPKFYPVIGMFYDERVYKVAVKRPSRYKPLAVYLGQHGIPTGLYVSLMYAAYTYLYWGIGYGRWY